MVEIGAKLGASHFPFRLPQFLSAWGMLRQKGALATMTATRRQKSNRFDQQNNSFARAADFLYISLPSLHDYKVKFPYATFY